MVDFVTPAAYKLMKMNPPPNECAAGSLCQGAGKTHGNHYCCRCKKTAHSVFCSKEVDSLEGNIKESFKDDEKKVHSKKCVTYALKKPLISSRFLSSMGVGAVSKCT
jgi:hypothetical protein